MKEKVEAAQTLETTKDELKVTIFLCRKMFKERGKNGKKS